MADFSQIIQEINDNVNTNGTGAITGAKLNEVLRDMIDSVDDKNVSKLVVSDISQLNQEQIESLRVGDSVVEQKKRQKCRIPCCPKGKQCYKTNQDGIKYDFLGAIQSIHIWRDRYVLLGRTSSVFNRRTSCNA